jgi:hypothetical protein
MVTAVTLSTLMIAAAISPVVLNVSGGLTRSTVSRALNPGVARIAGGVPAAGEAAVDAGTRPVTGGGCMAEVLLMAPMARQSLLVGRVSR